MFPSSEAALNLWKICCKLIVSFPPQLILLYAQIHGSNTWGLGQSAQFDNLNKITIRSAQNIEPKYM